jgi:hypothetical protein
MYVGAELSAALVFLRPSPYPNNVHIEKQVYTATQFKPREVNQAKVTCLGIFAVWATCGSEVLSEQGQAQLNSWVFR